MPTLPPIVVNATVGLVAGGMYGVLWFAHKHQKNDEPFNPFKLGGTLIVSAVVGASFALSGVDVTEESVVAVLAANTAIIALLEPILKSLADALGIFPNYT